MRKWRLHFFPIFDQIRNPFGTTQKAITSYNIQEVQL